MTRDVRFDAQMPDIKHTHLTPSMSTDSQRLSEKFIHISGAIYTPPGYARFLTSWAVQQPKDRVLDVGIGEGVFTFAAYHRLIELGATSEDAQNQVFGAEIDSVTYQKFCEFARSANIRFSNLSNANFFDINFPSVDAIIGNPPYVRRTYIENVDDIRQSVIERNLGVSDLQMTRMTDMYIYFLLRALPTLKPGGKLAVITSDPWLNVSYGEEFKRYLQTYFKIDTLITLDHRVFEDAQVKPVLLLATKREIADEDWHVQFVRVKSGLSIDILKNVLDNQDHKHAKDIISSTVKGCDLDPSVPWSIHFKAPAVYEALESHRFMTPMANVAETRIGIQTLAKDFFVLTQEQADATQIEAQFLEPLAQSIRYFREPIIHSDTSPPFYLFCCGKSKEELQDTRALEYILQGEVTRVEVRGKGMNVVGYHNKERIKRANRHYWYDLKSSFERRGSASILIPRLIYHTFNVLWNKALFVPGELFIEFLPPPGVDIEVYLAVLVSSVSEIMLRVHAQVYGGGTFNIGPGQIKSVPILNVRLLTERQKEDLKQAYLSYVSDQYHNRSAINALVYSILGCTDLEQQNLEKVLEDLLLLATSAKKSSST